jgi:hypothetical protein
MSGPWLCPVSALRSGMNSPLALAARGLLHRAGPVAPRVGCRALGQEREGRSPRIPVLVVDQRRAPSRNRVHQPAGPRQRGDVFARDLPERSARSAGTPKRELCGHRRRRTSSAPRQMGDRSNPSINSSSDPRSSTGCDEPSRAIRLRSAMGSTPAARRSRKDSVPGASTAPRPGARSAANGARRRAACRPAPR